MLIVKVYINDKQIGEATAQRVYGTTDPESMGTYEVNRIPALIVQHRYGDGAAVLAAKIVRVMEETP